jgi:hypothetical protein
MLPFGKRRRIRRTRARVDRRQKTPDNFSHVEKGRRHVQRVQEKRVPVVVAGPPRRRLSTVLST